MAMEHVGKDIGQDVAKVKTESQTKDTGFESQCPQSDCIHQSRDNLTTGVVVRPPVQRYIDTLNSQRGSGRQRGNTCIISAYSA